MRFLISNLQESFLIHFNWHQWRMWIYMSDEKRMVPNCETKPSLPLFFLGYLLLIHLWNAPYYCSFFSRENHLQYMHDLTNIYGKIFTIFFVFFLVVSLDSFFFFFLHQFVRILLVSFCLSDARELLSYSAILLVPRFVCEHDEKCRSFA